MRTGRYDAVFFNGHIVTMSGKRRTASALAVEDGRIVSVGGDSEVRRSASRGCAKHDLGGRTVVPGFIDCHTHFIQMGVDAMSVDLGSSRTIDEALSMMKAASGKVPEGEWVIGANWKESAWPDGRFITRADLDACCPGHPAVAHRVCGHMSSVNSQAISMLDIDARTRDAVTDVSGNLTGILKESAVGIVWSATAPDRARKIKGFRIAIRKAHSMGVTSIHDNGASDDFDIFRTAESGGKLGVRVWFNTPAKNIDSMLRLSLSTGIGSDRLRFGGVKVFCDGALGARTAALSKDYCDDPGNKGALVIEPKELDAVVEKAHHAGIQLAIHAIGDMGIGTTIASLELALKRGGRADCRHRIEHLELPSKEHLKTMRRLRIIASMQPNFIGEWGGTDGMYRARLGPERTSRNNPFREVLGNRIRLVFGSDCMPFSPLYGIHSAVNAPYASQRMEVGEALAAYTREASFASFEEGFKGTLSEGGFADFAVLSADPFVEPTKVSSLAVLKTVVNGEIVYERKKGGVSS